MWRYGKQGYFSGALSNLNMALKVGEAGVALEVDEIAPLFTPLRCKLKRSDGNETMVSYETLLICRVSYRNHGFVK